MLPICFRSRACFLAFSALENVSCVSRQKEAENRAKELLLLLSLSDDDMLKKPRELSGGMNQRVSLAELSCMRSATAAIP